MKQNPRQLINDIHDRISDDDSQRKILSGYSEDPTIWGYSKVWLFVMLVPAMLMFRVSANRLTGTAQLYGFGATVVLAALGILATVASPGDMDAREYFEAIVSQRAHQQEMIHDSAPDESRLEQPTNDSLLGRFARLPLVRDWPIIGADEYEPTQALVPHQKPFRDEYAIQREDGTLLAAIRVRAIPLRLESTEVKGKVERAVAHALEGTVDYDAQLISPTRVADFEHRRSQWNDRARDFQAHADRLRSARGMESSIDAIRQQILADIADERAAGINLYEDTKRIREHYVLVSVDPGEAVIERSTESGGLGSIPGVGKLIELKRLREQAGSEEHVTALVRKLERRADDLASELRRVDGLTPSVLSSAEFSEVIADHYRGVNVRAHDEFTQAIRGSPVPAGADAGDPEHEVSYHHITTRDRAGSPSSPAPTSIHAADGGVVGATETDTTASGPQQPATSHEPSAEDEAAVDINENSLVGLAQDDEELSRRYKATLAPDVYRRHDDCGQIDEDWYTKTLEVRDWPAIPRHGFFDRVASFSMPKVDVTLSTHLTGEDERQADRKLAGTADSLKGKVRSLARNKWIPDYFVEQVVEEYADVKRTQNTVAASEFGLYTSHTYIEVRAPDRDRLDKAVGRIRSRMQDVSADAKPLKYHHQLGYQTAAPACKNRIGGNTKMTGDGLSRLIPWTARNLIERGGIELGLNEDTGDPIVLDLQNRETGFNVGIWGTIGSGKTTTLTRLLTRTKMHNPEMPVVIIDPKEEFAGFTWLFDGERVTIGSDTGINPLQIEETPPEKLAEIGEEAPYRNAIRRAMDFVRSFYAYMGISFEDKQGTWRTAIQEAYRRRGITANPDTHHKDSPTFADDVFPIFEEMVNTPEAFIRDALVEDDDSKQQRKERAISILQNDIGALEDGGEFEHLSKATDIDIQNIDVLYLDLQNYDTETTAGLMMGPLLAAVLEQAKQLDEPMALAMDEFHYMLHNSSSLETLKQAYRHSRHSDLSMITATQSVEEFFTENDEGGKQLTKSASQLTKLMSVKLWHYLEEMNDEWAGEFDMSDAEQQYIEDASTGDPTAQALLQTQKKGSYRLDVDFSNELNPREFAMNQYDPTDHGSDALAYLDSYADRDGRDVTQWSWAVPSEPEHHPADPEQAQTGTELVDGTTVTTDVEDVDATPSDESDDESESPTQALEEPINDDAPTSGESALDDEPATETTSEGIETEHPDEEPSTPSNSEGDDPTDTTTDSEATEDGTDDGPSLTDLNRVTARRETALHDAGFETVEEVFEAETSALAETDGVENPDAAALRKQAAELLGRSDPTIDDPPTETTNSTTDTDPAATGATEGPELVETTEQSSDGSQAPESPADAENAGQADTTEASHDDPPEIEIEQDTTPTASEHPAELDPDDDTDPSEPGGDDDSDGSDGVWSRMKGGISSVFPHPAAGKAQPDLTDMGIVGKKKAAALRATGFETVEEVYTAETSALAEAEIIDEVHADVIQTTAKRALDASDAPVPNERGRTIESDTASAHDRETAETTGKPDRSNAASDTAALDASDAATASSSGSTGQNETTERDDVDHPVVTDIQQVGEARADVLDEAGYESVADVAAARQTALTNVDGIAGARAETIIESANTLLDGPTDAAGTDAAGGDD